MLSPLEREILELAATGLSSPQIAEQLDIRVTEVRRHLHAIIARLGARSKVHAIVLAIRAGYITLPAQ